MPDVVQKKSGYFYIFNYLIIAQFDANPQLEQLLDAMRRIGV